MSGRQPVVHNSTPTETPQLSEQARAELVRLAPKLAAALAEKLPKLSITWLETLEQALTATVTVKRAPKRKNGRPEEVEVPNWDLRKVALQMLYGLHIQIFDRGGASAVRTNEMAGSLDLNQNITERRLAEMSEEELQKEEKELSLLLDRSPSSGAPVTPKPSGRTPVF